MPRKDLADLIPLAGGQTVNQLRMANVILGHDYIEEFLENDKVVQISEKWLLDSLQQHCPLPFVDYLIQKWKVILFHLINYIMTQLWLEK